MRPSMGHGYGLLVRNREVLLTVLICPSDEHAVIDLVAQRFPDMPRIQFDVAEGHPDLRVQWAHEHPGIGLADRRCREVIADTTGTTAQRCTEHVLDVISPHARAEYLMTPPFPGTPDEYPWFAHTELWA